MELNIQPLGDVVIIERDSADDATAWGLILPPQAQEIPDSGIVRAVGDGKRAPHTCQHCGKKSHEATYPMELRPGDKVLYSKYANLPFKYNGKEYITMHEADIIGVVEDAP